MPQIDTRNEDSLPTCMRSSNAFRILLVTCDSLRICTVQAESHTLVINCFYVADGTLILSATALLTRFGAQFYEWHVHDLELYGHGFSAA